MSEKRELPNLWVDPVDLDTASGNYGPYTALYIPADRIREWIGKMWRQELTYGSGLLELEKIISEEK